MSQLVWRSYTLPIRNWDLSLYVSIWLFVLELRWSYTLPIRNWDPSYCTSPPFLKYYNQLYLTYKELRQFRDAQYSCQLIHLCYTLPIRNWDFRQLTLKLSYFSLSRYTLPIRNWDETSSVLGSVFCTSSTYCNTLPIRNWDPYRFFDHLCL